MSCMVGMTEVRAALTCSVAFRCLCLGFSLGRRGGEPLGGVTAAASALDCLERPVGHDQQADQQDKHDSDQQ